jgi:PAS domain S-box-containing protein
MATSVEAYENKYGASQQRLHQLLQWAEDPAIRATIPAGLVEELSTSLEELHVAAEIMHEQTDSLAEAQEVIDKERYYFQELFDLAPDGYLVTDQHAVIRRANRAAADFFHTEPKYLDGKPIHVLIWVEDRPDFRTWYQKALKHGGRDEWEGRLNNRAGGSFPALLSLATTRSRSGQVDHCRWLVRDLTERKRMENQLRERAAQLAQLNKGKDDFLALLGHELRNPLVPLRNLAPILEADSSPERLSWALGVLQRQVTSLTRLADDLLDASRLGRGKIQVHREPLDMAAVLRSVVEDHREALEPLGVSLTLELTAGPVPIVGDAARLGQVISNLLHNAGKFTPPGGKVNVRLTVDGDRAVIAVQDTGRGVAPELLPRLFDPFVQGKGSLGGLGLGLALVKGLIELHGGEVAAASDGPNRGTRFELCLPLAKQEPLPPRAAPPAMRPRCRILVIDDNRDVADSLHYSLELLGHQVETACSGAEGVEKMQHMRPDVVICDIGMAEMSGFAVAETLREKSPQERLPLIAYSGYGEEETQQRAKNAGFDLTLTKPVDLAQLQQAMTQLLAHSR